MKAQFLKEHYFFNYNGKLWTKANNVGRFFQLKDARYMIYHHVSESNKITFAQFPENIQKAITAGLNVSTKIQAETIFIDDKGMLDLVMNSHKPIAKAMKLWLVSEAIPAMKKNIQEDEGNSVNENGKEEESKEQEQGAEEEKENADINGDEEYKEKTDDSMLNATNLTEEFKKKVLEQHNFFEYNGQNWTKANVAQFLDLKNPHSMM